MTDETGNRSKSARGLWILANVNVVIWAIAIIAMVFVMQDSPAAKKIFPILAGGVAVGVSLISASAKLR